MAAKNALGDYLRQARENAEKMTQQQAALAVSQLLPPKKVSQGLIAQYESGKIILPDAAILRALARVYRIEYGELAFRLALHVAEKYAAVDESPLGDLTEQRLALWEAALTRFPTVGEVEGLEKTLLQTKASIVAQYEILDIRGLADWQKRLDPLTAFWVITPKFLDDNDPGILDAVVYNLTRQVRYVYFVRQADTEKGGRFQVLRRTLSRLASNLDKAVDDAQIDNLVRYVGIAEDDLRWINTDIVIANPLSAHPVGFGSTRFQGLPVFGTRLGDRDVTDIVARMADYAQEKQVNNVVSFSRSKTKPKSISKR